MKAAVVYLVTNRLNGNRYVGLTRFTSVSRWKEHARNANRGVKTYLYSAIRKYGADAFSVTDVASCLSFDSATQVEREVIRSLEPEYNQTNGGEFTVGKRVPPEVVERIIAANTGKKRTPEQKAAASILAKARYAKDTGLRERMAVQLAAVRPLIDQKKRMAAVMESRKTYVWSDESRAKLSASCMGRKYSADVIAKTAAKNRKPVECIELVTVFDSVSEAAEFTGIGLTNISKACLGKHKTAGGFHFTFAQSA